MPEFFERDICPKFILPALVRAGWDVQSQIREEVSLMQAVLLEAFERKEKSYTQEEKISITAEG